MVKRIPWPREQESFADIVLRLPLAKHIQKTTAKLDMSYNVFFPSKGSDFMDFCEKCTDNLFPKSDE